MMLGEAASHFAYQWIDNVKIHKYSKFEPIIPLEYSGEVLSKLKDRGFQATSLSTYGFSTLCTTLPHNLIKEERLELIERTFYKKEGNLYLACCSRARVYAYSSYLLIA